MRRNLGMIQQKANKAAKNEDDLLPKFDIHDLRHTYAMHLLHDRWAVSVVSRHLGSRELRNYDENLCSCAH